LLTSRDVLVIDEAGMVGTRQMERVLSHAADAGAKVVLVGDPQQLQAIEAGAAFRRSTNGTAASKSARCAASMTAGSRTPRGTLPPGAPDLPFRPMTNAAWCMPPRRGKQARGELIERWDRDRQASPGEPHHPHPHQ
jgi:hypothetical protein